MVIGFLHTLVLRTRETTKNIDQAPIPFNGWYNTWSVHWSPRSSCEQYYPKPVGEISILPPRKIDYHITRHHKTQFMVVGQGHWLSYSGFAFVRLRKTMTQPEYPLMADTIMAFDKRKIGCHIFRYYKTQGFHTWSSALYSHSCIALVKMRKTLTKPQ